MDKNKPILIVGGLAVVIIAVVLGLTRDRWMATSPSLSDAQTASSEQQQTGRAIQQTGQDAQQTGQSVQQSGQAQDQTSAAATEAATTSAKSTVATSEPAQTTTVTKDAGTAATGDQQATVPATGQPAGKATTEVATADQVQPPAETKSTGEQVAVAQPVTKTEEQAAPATEPPVETAVVPTFDTVRVEKSGEAVIAGRAEPGAKVAAKLNGVTIGTAIASHDGSFVIVPDAPLKAGTGALTLEATGQNDTAAVRSDQTVAVMVPETKTQDTVVAIVSPTEPTKVLQKPAADQNSGTAQQSATSTPAAKQNGKIAVSLDAVDYDGKGNIVFSGRGEPGAVARLYVDNALMGDATADNNSRWSFAGSSPIAPGVHTLRVDGLDANGKVANRFEFPFFREETSRVANNQVASASGDSTAPREGRVVIQPGNNLWRISTVIYGSGMKYTILYEANKDLIRDPDLIYPGQVFKTPDVVPPESIDPRRRDPLRPGEGAASGQ